MYTGVQLLLLVLTISVTAAAATAALSTETHHQHHQRHQQQQQQQSYDQHLQISWPFPRPPVDAVGNVQRLANCLYIQNNLSCVDEYCQQSVVTHGDGIWLPRTAFVGVQWVKQIHRDWFQAYTDWHFDLIEITASGAVKGFTEVFGLFHWQASNTGSYHGLTPTGRVSKDYGIIHATTDKTGKLTDIALWRGGFQEERDALLRNNTLHDYITPLKDITDQPFWIPSQSLQLKMTTRAHQLLEVLNQGEKYLDTLDDICTDNVIFIDGVDIWGPGKSIGLAGLKLWMVGWLQQYEVTIAVTGSAVTSQSNKVFLSFKMLLTDGATSQTYDVEGCLAYVFNIQGFMTHIIIYRNGTPKEMSDRFIRGVTATGSWWHPW
eukprot:jgi/Chrzof1/2615/Cz11g22160.t1